MSARTIGTLVFLLSLGRAPAEAASPSPLATPPAAGPSASASLAPVATAIPARATASPILPSPTPAPVRASVPAEALGEPVEPHSADGATTAPVATAAIVRPRAFRTPERAAPPAFVAPQAGAPAPDGDLGAAPAPPPAMGGRPATRASSSVVVFRVSARTALEGFDLRVGYPRSVGSFGTAARPAECNAGTGMAVAANDRGEGELRLLVASAQALPFPIDVFCRFTAEPGAGVGAADFAVRVAEVTSNGKRADPGLLLVSVVVP